MLCAVSTGAVAVLAGLLYWAWVSLMYRDWVACIALWLVGPQLAGVLLYPLHCCAPMAAFYVDLFRDSMPGIASRASPVDMQAYAADAVPHAFLRATQRASLVRETQIPKAEAKSEGDGQGGSVK